MQNISTAVNAVFWIFDSFQLNRTKFAKYWALQSGIDWIIRLMSHHAIYNPRIYCYEEGDWFKWWQDARWTKQSLQSRYISKMLQHPPIPLCNNITTSHNNQQTINLLLFRLSLEPGLSFNLRFEPLVSDVHGLMLTMFQFYFVIFVPLLN